MKFHPGEIEIQTRAGVRKNAEQVAAGIRDSIPPAAKAFLESQRAVFLATVDETGQPWASVLTGAPGFIHAVDPHNVAVAASLAPDDPLHRTLAREGHVALLAIEFASRRRIRLNGVGSLSSGVIHIAMRQVYGNCPKYIQGRTVTGETIAKAAPEAARSPELLIDQRHIISTADTFMIATDHAGQGADISHRGGNPGFVIVLDGQRIEFPDYSGNHMFNTLGNLAINPRAGLLFIDFASGRTLQLVGKASIDWDRDHADSFPGAERVIGFDLEEVVDRDGGFPLRTIFHEYSHFNPKA